MGEVHNKSPQSAAIGREVVSNFDYVGREGFDPEKTWGGGFKGRVVSPVLSKLGIKDRPQFWFARLIGKIIGKGGRTEGTTIAAAQVAEIRNNLVNNLKSISAQERSELIAKLEEIPERDRSGAISMGGLTLFTGNEILDLAKLAADGRDLPAISGPKETFHLEAGHKPDIWENIQSIEGYITVGLLAGYYTAEAFIPPHIAEQGAYAISALSAYKIAGSLLSNSRFQTAKWYQRIFPLSLGVIRGRNSTMVNNIESTFTNRGEVDQLLAIVGKAHIPEMKQLLQRMGYTAIPLPEAAQMQMQDAVDATAKP